MTSHPDIAAAVGDAPPQTAYERLLARHVLGYQHCADCQAAVFSPRVLCPACGSRELAWRASAGVGTVYSVTTISPRGEESYAVALVDLDEGFRMMSNVVDVPAEEVRIDARVSVVFGDTDDGPLPFFRPVA